MYYLLVHVLIKSFNQCKDRYILIGYCALTLKTDIMPIIGQVKLKITIIRLANPFLILILTLKERRVFCFFFLSNNSLSLQPYSMLPENN